MVVAGAGDAARDGFGRERRPTPRFFNAYSDHRADDLSMLTDALGAALELTAADMGNVQLIDREAGGLRIVTQRNLTPEFLRHFELVDDRGSACGLALRSGRRVVVPDVATSPVFDDETTRGVMARAEVRAVQSVPLRAADGTVVGVISVHYRDTDRLTGADQRLLGLLAQRAGRLYRGSPPAP
ncbi:MAG TPA: GAF domain-containing protein [Thermomonospora sp.]|nr:GAF domain-containing protein [Thermomonospora sp.]